MQKNAILMIDFALDAQHNQGMTPEKAIHDDYDRCLMGALPIIALGLGAGAELRQPLGLSLLPGSLHQHIYLYLDRYAGNGPLEIPPSVLEGT